MYGGVYRIFDVPNGVKDKKRWAIGGQYSPRGQLDKPSESISSAFNRVRMPSAPYRG